MAVRYAILSPFLSYYIIRPTCPASGIGWPRRGGKGRCHPSPSDRRWCGPQGRLCPPFFFLATPIAVHPFGWSREVCYRMLDLLEGFVADPPCRRSPWGGTMQIRTDPDFPAPSVFESLNALFYHQKYHSKAQIST